MCLVCGEMLCSQSYCCQTELGDSRVGAATSHAHSCAAGTALFLRYSLQCIAGFGGGRVVLSKGLCFSSSTSDMLFAENCGLSSSSWVI